MSTGAAGAAVPGDADDDDAGEVDAGLRGWSGGGVDGSAFCGGGEGEGDGEGPGTVGMIVGIGVGT